MAALLPDRRLAQGVTLIELLIGVALLAVIMAIGIPSFNAIIERKHVEGAAEKLFADLQFAKSEAIKRNAQVFVTFDETNQCYGLSLAAGCSCNTTPSDCQLDSGVVKVIKMTEFGNTTIPTGGVTFSGDEVFFDPRRGTTTKLGHVEFQSPRGKQARVYIGNFFRIRICSPSGSANIFTYEDCT